MLGMALLIVRAVAPKLLSAVAEREPVNPPYVPLNKRVPAAPEAVISTTPAEEMLPIVRFPVPSLNVIPLPEPLLLKVTNPPKLLALLARLMAAAPAVIKLVPVTVKAPV